MFVITAYWNTSTTQENTEVQFEALGTDRGSQIHVDMLIILTYKPHSTLAADVLSTSSTECFNHEPHQEKTYAQKCRISLRYFFLEQLSLQSRFVVALELNGIPGTVYGVVEKAASRYADGAFDTTDISIVMTTPLKQWWRTPALSSKAGLRILRKLHQKHACRRVPQHMTCL